jgi:hypothetical protein
MIHVVEVDRLTSDDRFRTQPMASVSQPVMRFAHSMVIDCLVKVGIRGIS